MWTNIRISSDCVCFDFQNKWVCEERWKSRLPHTMYRLGSLIGVIVVGSLADTYGRVPTIVVCFVIAGVAGLLTLVTTDNYVLFLLCRAMMGFTTYKGMTPMIFATEFMGANGRALVSNGILLVTAMTQATLPWVAYFIRDWRTLNVFTSASMFIVPFLTLYVFTAMFLPLFYHTISLLYPPVYFLNLLDGWLLKVK